MKVKYTRYTQLDLSSEADDESEPESLSLVVSPPLPPLMAEVSELSVAVELSVEELVLEELVEVVELVEMVGAAEFEPPAPVV